MNHFFLGSPSELCPSLHHCTRHSSWCSPLSLPPSATPVSSLCRDPACFISVP